MKRGVITGLMALESSPLFAHVSTAERAAHVDEHLWLLLPLAPVLLAGWPVVLRFSPVNKR